MREAYEWAHERAPNTVDRWFDRFREAIRSLESQPERRPLAAENRKVSLEVRELHFGRRPNVFRVIFHIDGNYVRVLRIRRGQRRLLTQSEISEAVRTDEKLDLGYSSETACFPEEPGLFFAFRLDFRES